MRPKTNVFLLTILVILSLNVYLATGKNLSEGDKNRTRAADSRSDTVDILHYNISLRIVDFTHKLISGNCEVQFKSKLNGINQLILDLLKLNVDSVKQNNKLLSFLYDSTELTLNLSGTLQQGDSTAVTVYYHGTPQMDSTFGGFSFSNNYAYNIGVGFSANPHNFGRAWHPCVDNFVERATYDFHITTALGNRAQCNGVLIDSVNNADTTTTWNWHFGQEIESYLACVAVSNYAIVRSTLNGMNGPVPVQIAVVPSDSAALKKTFLHLPGAFATFENRYGPYRWVKVGYSVVPFNGGAMEHATNIAFPLFGVTGDLTWEYIMAHELSHHWFGDLVTCSTEEDMWLNEGWAQFSEKIFYEGVYGHATYLQQSAGNHEIAVHYAHLFDNGYLPVSGISHQYTYGLTVYYKGSEAAHTLRGYMGDSLFFHCLQNYLHDHAFTSQSSNSFMKYLSTCSNIDLTPFFNNWIFTPGWPQFSIDTFMVSPSGSTYNVTVYIRQKLDNAPSYFTDVPLEVTFMDANWKSVTVQAMVGGPCTSFTTNIPINPVFACTDLAEKISDAITENYDTIRATGTYNYMYGKMDVTVDSLKDSAFLRIEHNFVAPDPMKHPIPNLHLSTERYWKVDGIIPPGFSASASIIYDGSAPTPVSLSGDDYLDTKLITNSEDSLVLMYRPSVSADWQRDTDIVLKIGSQTDKRGVIIINHLQKGEYALAIYQQNKIDSIPFSDMDNCLTVLAVKDIPVLENSFTTYPSPAAGNFTIEGTLTTNCHLDIFNINGQNIYTRDVPVGRLNLKINSSGWGRGLFLIRLTDSSNHAVVRRQVIVN